MLKLLKYTLIFTCLFCVNIKGESKTFNLATLQDVAKPVINSLSAKSGIIGTPITIYGYNFNQIPENNIVYFGEVTGKVLRASINQLVVLIPTAAKYAQIKVITNGFTATSYDFFNPILPNGPTNLPINKNLFKKDKDIKTKAVPTLINAADITNNGKLDLAIANKNDTSHIVKNLDVNITYSVINGALQQGTDYILEVNPDIILFNEFGIPDTLKPFSVRFYSNYGVSPNIWISQFFNAFNNQYQGKLNVTLLSDPSFGNLFVRFNVPSNINRIKYNGINNFQNRLPYHKKYIFDGTSFDRNFNSLYDTGLYFYRNADNLSKQLISNNSILNLPATFLNLSNVSSTHFADLDNDGKLDLLVTFKSLNNFSVYRNVSNSLNLQFQYAANYFLDSTLINGLKIANVPSSIKTSDLDEDGKLDIIVAVYNPANNVSKLRVIKNKSNLNNFIFDTIGFYGNNSNLNITKINVADLDQDGRIDVITTDTVNNKISIFKNINLGDGVINFSNQIEITNVLDPYNLEIADFDGNGKYDLIVGDHDDSTFTIFKNNSIVGDQHSILNSNIIFNFSQSINTGSKVDYLVIQDINGDNKIDIVTANAIDSNINFYRNISTAIPDTIQFIKDGGIKLNSQIQQFILSDLDNDNKVDIAYIDKINSEIHVLFDSNLINISNQQNFNFYSDSLNYIKLNSNYSNFGNGNAFILELSDINGNFENPIYKDSIVSSNLIDSLRFIFNSSFSHGENSSIRIRSTNPQIISEYRKIGIIEPTKVDSLSKVVISKGDLLKVYGKGFNNFFNNITITLKSTTDSILINPEDVSTDKIEFVIPNNINDGIYAVLIKNDSNLPYINFNLIKVFSYKNLKYLDPDTITKPNKTLFKQLYPQGLNNVVSIYADEEREGVLLEDGTVHLFGTTDLVNNVNLLQVPSQVKNVVDFRISNNNIIALLNNGKIIGWGSYFNPTINQFSNISNILNVDSIYNNSILALSGNSYSTIAININNKLVGWAFDSNIIKTDINDFNLNNNYVQISSGELGYIMLNSDKQSIQIYKILDTLNKKQNVVYNKSISKIDAGQGLFKQINAVLFNDSTVNGFEFYKFSNIINTNNTFNNPNFKFSNIISIAAGLEFISELTSDFRVFSTNINDTNSMYLYNQIDTNLNFAREIYSSEKHTTLLHIPYTIKVISNNPNVVFADSVTYAGYNDNKSINISLASGYAIDSFIVNGVPVANVRGLNFINYPVLNITSNYLIKVISSDTITINEILNYKSNTLALTTNIPYAGYAVGDYIRLPRLDFVNEDYTVETWYKHNGPMKIWERIFDFGTDFNGPNYQGSLLTFSPQNQNNLDDNIVLHNNNRDIFVLYPQGFDPNVWNHYAFSVGNQRLKLYINGNLVLDTPQGRAGASFVVNYIGRSNWSQDPSATAQFEDFRIWEDEKDVNQIRKYMFKKLKGSEPNLLYWLPLNYNNSLIQTKNIQNQTILSNASSAPGRILDNSTVYSVNGGAKWLYDLNDRRVYGSLSKDFQRYQNLNLEISLDSFRTVNNVQLNRDLLSWSYNIPQNANFKYGYINASEFSTIFGTKVLGQNDTLQKYFVSILPDSPSNVVASKVVNGINLTFTPPAYLGSNTLINYAIYNNRNNNVVYTKNIPVLLDIIGKDSFYKFKVSAINEVGESNVSAYSNEVSNNTKFRINTNINIGNITSSFSVDSNSKFRITYNYGSNFKIQKILINGDSVTADSLYSYTLNNISSNINFSVILVSNIIKINYIDEIDSIGKSARFPNGATYILQRDLDFLDNNSYSNNIISLNYTTGEGWVPLNLVNTKFDGNGHTISNLYSNINFVRLNGVSLFGKISKDTIINLGIINANVSGIQNVSIFAADVNYSYISNCYVTGKFVASTVNAAPFIINANNTTILKSYAKVNGKGGGYVAGFVNKTNFSFINYCYTVGQLINYDTTVGYRFAGFVLDNLNSTIQNSYSLINLRVNVNNVINGADVASFVYTDSNASILSCYSITPNIPLIYRNVASSNVSNNYIFSTPNISFNNFLNNSNGAYFVNSTKHFPLLHSAIGFTDTLPGQNALLTLKQISFNNDTLTSLKKVLFGETVNFTLPSPDYSIKSIYNKEKNQFLKISNNQSSFNINNIITDSTFIIKIDKSLLIKNVSKIIVKPADTVQIKGINFLYKDTVFAIQLYNYERNSTNIVSPELINDTLIRFIIPKSDSILDGLYQIRILNNINKIINQERLIRVFAGKDRTNIYPIAWSPNFNDPVVRYVTRSNPNNLVEISGGNSYILGLKATGEIIALGSDINNNGVLLNRYNVNNVVNISAGFDHNIVLLNNGTIRVWGGVLDTNDVIANSYNDFVQVSAGLGYNVALNSKGKLFVWNNNELKTEVDNSNLFDIVKVATCNFGIVALRANGSLATWRNKSLTEFYASLTNMTPTDSNYINVFASAGSNVFYALKKDSTIVAWGVDTVRTIPENIRNLKFKQISINKSGSYVAGLKTDGTIAIWGKTPSGNTDFPSGPSQLNYQNITTTQSAAVGLYANSVSLSSINKYIVKKGDSLILKGRNFNNSDHILLTNLNNNYDIDPDNDKITDTTINFIIPNTLPNGVYSLKINNFTLGNIYTNSLLIRVYSEDSNKIAVWGDTSSNNTTLLNGASNFVNVIKAVAGNKHGIALLNNGNVVGWGGSSLNENSSSNIPIGLNNIVDISAGNNFSSALSADGTFKIWGRNSENWDYNINTNDTPSFINLNKNIIKVSIGKDFILALKDNGTIVYWYGKDTAVQSNLNRSYPISKQLNSFKNSEIIDIASGNLAVLLYKDSTTGFFGYKALKPLSTISRALQISANYNEDGDTSRYIALLPNDTIAIYQFTSSNNIPIQYRKSTNNITKLSAGNNYNYALLNNGNVYYWSNRLDTFYKLPNNISTVKDIDAGYKVSVALISNLSQTIQKDTIFTQVINGNISENQIINRNDSVKITYSPFKGFKLKSVYINNDTNINYKDSLNSFTFRNINSNNQIKVSYILDTFLLQIISDTNSAILNFSKDSQLNINSNVILSIKTKQNKFISNIFINSIDILQSNHIFSFTYNKFIHVNFDSASIQLSNVDTSITIEILYSSKDPNKRYLTIQSNISNAAVISPVGFVGIPFASSQIINIATNRGYLIDSIFINNMYRGNFNTYTFNNLRNDSAIYIKFKVDTFNYILFYDTSKGKIFNSNGLLVLPNILNKITILDTINFNINSNVAYNVDSIILNNSFFDSISNFTYANKTNSDSLKISFKKKKFVVYTSAINGTITPNTFVEYGDSLSILFNPNKDYILDSIFVNNNYIFSNSLKYTLYNIQQNDTILVKFKSNVLSIDSLSAYLVNTNQNIIIKGKNFDLTNSVIKLKSGNDSFEITPINIQSSSIRFAVPNLLDKVYSLQVNDLSRNSNYLLFRHYSYQNTVMYAFGDSTNNKLNVPNINEPVVKAVGGGNHSLALLYNGDVIGWGANDSNQITIPQNVHNVVDIAAGATHSLALLFNGTVVGWGNSANSRLQPTNNLNNNFIAISAGRVSSLGLKINGSIVSWGLNLNPTPNFVNPFIYISSGEFHNLGIKNDSTVEAWGDSSNGRNNVPNNLNYVKSVAAGGGHSIALQSNGNISIWGANTEGEGVIPVGLNVGVSKIAAGQTHNLILKDNIVYAWGGNSYKQSTIPSFLNSNVGIFDISAGGNHNIVLLPAQIFTFSNNGGQISNSKITYLRTSDSIQFVANPNYFIDSIIVNNQNISDITPYTNNIRTTGNYVFNNINRLNTIRVVFKRNNNIPFKFKITAQSPLNGTLSIRKQNGTIINNGDSVEDGTIIIFRFAPNNNYRFNYFNINNGNNITNISDSFVTTVTENINFNVNFIIKTFKLVSINASQASFGVVTPSLTTVNAGADASLTITPSAGYKVDSIFRFNGNSATKNILNYNNSNTISILNITDSTTIYVKFIIIPASVPVITVQPISQNITIPINTVTFTVTATVQDNGTLSYQWYKKGKNDVEFSVIPNATSREFIVSNPIKADSGTLLKVSITNTVNNGAGNLVESVFSSEALLRIFNLPTKPIVGAVTRNPSGTITENNEVNFYITASKNDGGELTYYWQYKLKNSTIWENYNNYIYTANLNIPNTNYKYNGASFRVIVHNTINNVFDSAVSASIILDMASIAEIAGKVLGGVAGGIIGGGVILAGGAGIGYGLYGGGGVFGASTTTGIDIIGGEASLLGIEGLDFIPTFGETTIPIIFSTGTLGAIVGGTIGVAVIVGGVGVGIAAGVVYGNDPGTGYDSPAISFHPQNTYQKTGYSLTFLVRASANLADRLSYQWQSSTDGINFTNIPNATDTNYITPVLTLSDNQKKYRVIVTAHYGNTTLSRISKVATAYITNTNLYIINTLASAGGTISPSGEYAAGVYGSVQFAPNPGFEVDKIIVDNVVVLSNAAGTTSYYFSNLSASHTIVVTFKPIIYTITVNTKNNHGQVQSYSFSAFANSIIRIPYTTLNGYLFKNVEIINIEQYNNRFTTLVYPDSTNGITFTVNNNTVVNVNFIVKNLALKKYFNDVLIRIDSFPFNTRNLRTNFGSINGYTINYILLNGVRIDSTLGYTIDSFKNEYTLNIKATPNIYNIRVQRYSNTTLLSDTIIQNTFGNLLRLPVSFNNPNLRNIFQFSSLNVNGVYFNDSINFITLGSIPQDYLVKINYLPNVVTVTQNSIITTIQTRVVTNSTTVTSVPLSQNFRIPFVNRNLNLELKKVTINSDTNNVLLDSTNGYTLNNLTNNSIVNLFFNDTGAVNFINTTFKSNLGNQLTNNLVVNKGDNYRITYSPTDVYFNLDSVIVSDTPNRNFALDSINGYTFKNIQSNKSIFVSYNILKYKVKVEIRTLLTNGSYQTFIDSVFVNPTANFRITYSNNNGYGFQSIFVNNSSKNWFPDSLGGYTFRNILGDSSIQVNTIQNSYNIITKSNINGTIGNSVNVYSGQNGRINFNFNRDKYNIDSLIVDSIGRILNTDTLTGYTFTNVYRNRRIDLYLSIKNILISTQIDNGGIINDSFIVNYGTDTNIYFNAFIGNIIDSLIIDSAGFTKVIVRPNFNSIKLVNVINPINIRLKTKQLRFIQIKGDSGIIVRINKLYNSNENAYKLVDSIQNDSLLHYYNYLLGDSVLIRFMPKNERIKIDSIFINDLKLSKIQQDSGLFNTDNLQNNVFIKLYSSNNLALITTSINDTNKGNIIPTNFVKIGSNYKVTYKNKPGYKLDSVIVNNRFVKDSINSYTFNNVLSDSNIRVIFKLDSFKVQVISGINGTITPVNDTFVTIFDTLNYTIRPNQGFYIDSIIINGQNQANYFDTIFTLVKIDTNKLLRVTFTTRRPNTSYISSLHSTGGLIIPTGLIPVINRSSQKFQISINKGYLLDSLLVNGIKVDSTSSYTFNNVRGDSTIYAKFKPDTFNIVTNVNFGGIVVNDANDTLLDGSIKNYTITDTLNYLFVPNIGYKLDSVILNNNKIDTINNNKLVLTNRSSLDTLKVWFSKIKYNIITSAVNGQISSNTSVNYGDDIRITYNGVNDGYVLDSVLVNNILVRDSVLGYTFRNVQKNDTIQVKYKILLIGISSLSKSIVRSGDTITIQGNYLNTDGNRLDLRSTKNQNDSLLVNLFSQTSTSAKFILPNNLLEGLYLIRVKDATRSSNFALLRVYNHSNIVVVAFGDTSFGKVNVPLINRSVVKAVGGGNHSIALLENGSLIGWGKNDSNQINIPILQNVVDIAAGSNHSLALLSNGSVVGWGRNDNKQRDLANNIHNGHLIQVSAGRIHSIGLLETGRPIGWGGNNVHQTDVPDTLQNIVSITSGEFHNLGLKSDGTVWAWGDSSNDRNNVPANLNGVVGISSGGGQSVALLATGSLVVWGANSEGEGLTPSINNAVKVSSGQTHNIVLRSDSTLYAWGGNAYNQTKIPSYLNKNNILDISAGGNHNLVLLPVKIFTESSFGGRIDMSKLTKLGSVDTINFSANANYIIDSIIVNGKLLNNDGSNRYIFNNIAGLQFIRVSFKLNTVNIISNIVGKGQIISSVDTLLNIGKGTNVRVTFRPDEGYYVNRVFVNNRLVDSINSYSFNNIQQDSFLRVEFNRFSYLITQQPASVGGVVKDTIVYYGDTLNEVFNVQNGYKIDSILENGVNLGAINIYTINGVRRSYNFVTYTSRQSYLVRTITTRGGLITNDTKVFYGDSLLINYSAKLGYKLDSIKVNNILVDSPNYLWIKNIQSEILVQAYFKAKVYPIVKQVIGDGSVILGKDSITIEDTIKLVTRANDGSYIDTISINNILLNPDSINYITSAIDTQRIKVIFKSRGANRFIIKSSKSVGGTIYPFGNTIIPLNGSQLYSIIPDAGYNIDSLIVNGRNIEGVNNYTFENVQGDSNIRVVFKYQNRSKILKMKVFIEGYIASQATMRPVLSLANATGHCDECLADPSLVDTINIELRNAQNNVVLKRSGILRTNGNVDFNLGTNLDNGSYYILIKNKNTVETWSANLVSFADTITNYDFSVSPSRAYGNNLKSIGGVYALYSGHVHLTDQTIDLDDLVIIRSDFRGYESGYIVTDINGNGYVDTDDLVIFKLNFINYISSISPFDEE